MYTQGPDPLASLGRRKLHANNLPKRKEQQSHPSTSTPWYLLGDCQRYRLRRGRQTEDFQIRVCARPFRGGFLGDCQKCAAGKATCLMWKEQRLPLIVSISMAPFCGQNSSAIHYIYLTAS